MDPVSVFNWTVLCCNCLVFLFLGLILVLWVLSPRVEGTYKDRPQRHSAEHRQRMASRRARPESPPPAPKPPRRPRAPGPSDDVSALSATLAEAQRAAEAIDDIQIIMPVFQGPELEVKFPEALEMVTSEVPWSRAAETVQVTVDGETHDGLEAIVEAGARAAVEQVAERVEHAVPAAEPVTRRVREAARQAPSPLSAPTLAEGIEIILQDLVRREAEPLRQAIHVEPTAEGGVRIAVGDRFYFSVAEMPEGRAKGLLQQALRRWNELWQGQDRTAEGKR